MKPKLLYIYRDPMEWRSPAVQNEYVQRDESIIYALVPKFSIATKKNLLTLKPSIASTFSYILTHLQNDPETQTFTYEKSLAIISNIHEQFPDIKIVVYTGASYHTVTEEQLKEAGAKAVIRKQSIRHLEEDVEEVKNCLERLLNEQP